MVKYGNLRLVFDAFFVSVVLFIVFCIYSLFLRKLCVKSAKALFLISRKCDKASKKCRFIGFLYRDFANK